LFEIPSLPSFASFSPLPIYESALPKLLNGTRLKYGGCTGLESIIDTNLICFYYYCSYSSF